MEDAGLFDLLMSLSQKYAKKEQKIRKQLQLSPAQYLALRSLGSKEKTSCKEFSQRLTLSVSRGSRIIDKLYERGYVQRVDCQEDRRCKTIWLTKQGVTVRQKIHQHLREYENLLLSNYSRKNRENLKLIIRELIEKAEVDRM